MKSKWINVKDRLPKEEGYYLISIKDDDVIIGHYDPESIWYRVKRDGSKVMAYWTADDRDCSIEYCCCDSSLDTAITQPTHWQPLPEPPKEEK